MIHRVALGAVQRSLLSVALTLAIVTPDLAAQTAPPTYGFTNGRWFDGMQFVPREFYSVDGVLTGEQPAVVDSVIDLEGKFIVPPFGEAHNHNVEGESVDGVIERYLDAGIYYVKNPNSLPRSVDPIRDRVNTPRSIDVTFAGGGLTGSGGHPLGLVQRNIDREIWTEADGEGAFVHTIDTASDIGAKWPGIESGGPDFIKTYLLYSEEFAERRDDDEYAGWKGLDPELLPLIVERAHAAGLRVSTHVETATDFHYAVVAGVDEINHTPGFRPEMRENAGEINPQRYLIAEQDAQLAAEAGTSVVTTLGQVIEYLVDGEGVDQALAESYLDVIQQNVAGLRRQGVPLAIGSDNYQSTSLYEVRVLYGTGWFDNLSLLKAWSEVTPWTIFPDRQIGRLESGYEASFLVLEGDPVVDFANVERIVLRVKQGVLLISD